MSEKQTDVMMGKLMSGRSLFNAMSGDTKQWVIENTEDAISLAIESINNHPKKRKRFKVWGKLKFRHSHLSNFGNIRLFLKDQGFRGPDELMERVFKSKGFLRSVSVFSDSTIHVCIASTEELLGRSGTWLQVKERIKEIGAYSCHPEFVFAFIEKLYIYKSSEPVIMVMEPIEYGGSKFLFSIERGGGKLEIYAHSTLPGLYDGDSEAGHAYWNKKAKWLFFVPGPGDLIIKE